MLGKEGSVTLKVESSTIRTLFLCLSWFLVKINIFLIFVFFSALNTVYIAQTIPLGARGKITE